MVAGAGASASRGSAVEDKETVGVRGNGGQESVASVADNAELAPDLWAGTVTAGVQAEGIVRGAVSLRLERPHWPFPKGESTAVSRCWVDRWGAG